MLATPSPARLLRWLDDNPEKLERLRRQELIFAVGNGDGLVHQNRELSGKLWGRGIGNALREWDGFAHVDGYKVELVADPGRGKLSKGEVTRLLEVSGRYRDVDDWALVEETHTFQEWIDNFPGDNGAAEIPWEDTLAAVGRSGWKEAIEQEEADQQTYDKVFGPR